jgi:hypothetical protein
MRAFCLCARTSQAEGLIFENVPVLRRFALLDDLERGMDLHAGDEEHARISPLGEQPIVVVAPVINHDGAGCEGYLPGGLDVGDFAVSHPAEARQIVVVVEHQVQLDRTRGAAVLRPIVHRQAQVDHGRVEADQRVLEAEFMFAHGCSRHDVEQPVEHLLAQFPRTMAIGVGARRAGSASMLRWASLPSQLFSPPSISRRAWARPT